MDINKLTSFVIETSIHIHKSLGPGLLESVYEKILFSRLLKSGLHIEKQKNICFEFEDIKINNGFRIDLLVENKLILEIKSIEHLSTVHYKQLLTYLKLMNIEVGLLLNFGSPFMKAGIKRIVNNYSGEKKFTQGR